ncbi:MAG TPA: hypothetical protein VFM10_08250 [Terriglobales bacterium]|jgi:hypothetical protein|nr:hypothetical protein [Terriglobales bacterium]
MASKQSAGAGGIFWITFILLGLLILIGISYWMIKKPNPVPHSPEKTNGAIWSKPVRPTRMLAKPA